MNHIKILQITQALSVSVGGNYSEDQLMHILLDTFHQGGKYSTQITRYQADLRRVGKFTDQKYLSISYLQTDYLNLNRSSICGENNDRENLVQTKYIICGGANYSAENISKGSERRSKNFVRLVIWTNGGQNVQLANVSDADMNIT